MQEVSLRAPVPNLAAPDRAIIERRLVDIVLGALLRRIHELGPAAVGARVAAMARAGQRPSDGLHEAFWVQVLLHASSTKNVVLAKRAFQSLVAPPPGLPAVSVAASEKWQELVDAAAAGPDSRCGA